MDQPPFTCAKSMVHGPCGGVTANGLCEVTPEPCPFVDDVVLSNPASTEHRPRSSALGTTLIDLVLPADDAELAAIADIYRSTGSTAGSAVPGSTPS